MYITKHARNIVTKHTRNICPTDTKNYKKSAVGHNGRRDRSRIMTSSTPCSNPAPRATLRYSLPPVHHLLHHVLCVPVCGGGGGSNLPQLICDATGPHQHPYGQAVAMPHVGNGKSEAPEGAVPPMVATDDQQDSPPPNKKAKPPKGKTSPSWRCVAVVRHCMSLWGC